MSLVPPFFLKLNTKIYLDMSQEIKDVNNVTLLSIGDPGCRQQAEPALQTKNWVAAYIKLRSYVSLCKHGRKTNLQADGEPHNTPSSTDPGSNMTESICIRITQFQKH